MTRGIQTLPVPYCPDCGAPMALRRPRPGQEWEPFFGCSLFPACYGMLKVGKDGKPKDEDYGRLDHLEEPEWR